MAAHALQIDAPPVPKASTMLLAFTGWMDGGDVSTGTVRRLIDRLDARPFAHIESEGFYIDNFPGAMEITSLFRPHAVIEDGLIRRLETTHNEFFAASQPDVLFFVGKEPNLRWPSFGDCIFELAAQAGVRRIIFVGSFGGSVPHTRQPRLYATVSDASLKPALKKYGVRWSDYAGPASLITYLMNQAAARGVEMASLVAEIPAYIQGENPLCIEAVCRRLALILEVKINLAKLRGDSNEWESRISTMVEKDAKLAKHIRKLEMQYDNDLLATAEADRPEEEEEDAAGQA